MSKELMDAIITICGVGAGCLLISTFCLILFTIFKLDYINEQTKFLRKRNNKKDIQKVVIVKDE